MSEFLGPYGKATIILMRSHFDSDLPKLKDLKKLVKVHGNTLIYLPKTTIQCLTDTFKVVKTFLDLIVR